MDDDFNADFICMGTNENEVSLLEKKREGHAICAALYCKLLFLRNTVDLCTRQRLMQFASTNMYERIDIPQISLGLLNGMVKSDFPNEKSHAQWKKRQMLLFGIDTPRNWEIISTTLLVADAVWAMVGVQARPMIEPHPKVRVARNSGPNGSTGVSWPLILSWIVNILEELLCSANNRTTEQQTIGSLLTKEWDIIKSPSERAEVLLAIRELVLVFSSAPARFGIHGETCYWTAGYHLNIRLYEKLLFGLFDILEEGQLIEEVDEVLKLIKLTWSTLGINQKMHNALFGWVLFQQFVATDEATLLDYAILEVQKVLSADNNNEKEERYMNSLMCSTKPYFFRSVLTLALAVGNYTFDECGEIKSLFHGFNIAES
ncbi:hypothetical protein CsSME_00050374 [Camellia sinensis var. sinensis]